MKWFHSLGYLCGIFSCQDLCLRSLMPSMDCFNTFANRTFVLLSVPLLSASLCMSSCPTRDVIPFLASHSFIWMPQQFSDAPFPILFIVLFIHLHCQEKKDRICTPNSDIVLILSFIVQIFTEICRSNHMFVATQDITRPRCSIDYLFQGNPWPFVLSSSLQSLLFRFLMQHLTGIG